MAEPLSASALPIAKVCATCEPAIFRDTANGFEAALSPDGTCRLKFSCESPLLPSRELWIDSLPNLPRLKDSWRNGCDFCGFLRESALSSDVDDCLQRTKSMSMRDISDCSVSLSVYYVWGDEVYWSWENMFRSSGRAPLVNRDMGLSQLVLEVRVADLDIVLYLRCFIEGIPGDYAVTQWLTLPTPTPQSYTDQSYLDWSISGLQACSLHHHETVDEGFIPEILIDIQGIDPRLVHRRDLHRSGADVKSLKYSTLSYCWGSEADAAQHLKTTTATLPHLRERIDITELPAVVKDAIWVCRALSIPYLWVDALCINQDDPSDWERQCAQMTSIYGNAYLTICAASSSSCKETFLRQRGRRIRVPFQSALRPGIQGSFHVQLKYVTTSRLPHIGAVHEDTAESRWDQRGWVFQEKRSATRMLIFGHATMHLICGEKILNFSPRDSGRPDNPESDVLSIHEIVSEDAADIYRQEWPHLVSSYSQLTPWSFNNANDTLPALSGVAALFAKRLDDIYFAGIWKRNLLHGLVWVCRSLRQRDDHFSRLAQRGDGYIAPSWCPLGRYSIEGVANWESVLIESRDETEVLEAETVPDGENPFGRVKNGWLRVRSKVLDLGMLDSKLFEVCRSVWGETLSYGGEIIGDIALDYRYIRRYLRDRQDDAAEQAAILKDIGSMKLLLLGSFKVRLQPNHDERDASEKALGDERGAFGLVLWSVPELPQYYRVGLFIPNRRKRIGDGLRIFERLAKVNNVIII